MHFARLPPPAAAAVKVFHQGNGFCGWPYIEIKCSPAKLVQGHNIYGFDDLGFSVNNMIWLLNEKYPQLGGGFLESDEIGATVKVKEEILDSSQFERKDPIGLELETEEIGPMTLSKAKRLNMN